MFTAFEMLKLKQSKEIN